jgi:hypothetical protein
MEPTTVLKESVDPDEIDPELVANAKESMAIVIPHKVPFWEIQPAGAHVKEKKKFLFIFKRPVLKEEEAKALGKAVLQAPGNSRGKINKLIKKYPHNGVLMMYSAMSTFGMILNSAHKDESLSGFKVAVKEAATALLSDQISLNHTETFFKIYFAYLDRFKRFQIETYEQMAQEPRLEDLKQPFLNAIQLNEQLYSDRLSIQKILNRLKHRMKPAMQVNNIEFALIKEAAHHIINNNPSEKCRVGTASETIAYAHALGAAFARIPILFPVVDKIVASYPDISRTFLLRKISINSTRNFVKFRMAAAEGEKDTMTKICKTLLRENTFAITKLEGQSLYQPYETDPFFNLAFLAELSHGLYSDSDHQEIVDSAIKAMDAIINRDMSKNHGFTENANRLTHKLATLKSSATDSDTEQSPTVPNEEAPAEL